MANKKREILKNVVMGREIDENFIIENELHLDWKLVCRNQILSEGFMRKYFDKLHLPSVFRIQTVSEEFIKKYIFFVDDTCWKLISRHQTLSEEFIDEYSDEVYWSYISRYQKLSEEFILKNKEKLNWNIIFDKYTLSQKTLVLLINMKWESEKIKKIYQQQLRK